jgi:CxxC motif-containing protein (DUF1111 family)
LFILEPRRGVLQHGPTGRLDVQLHQVHAIREAAGETLLAKLGMQRTPSPNPAEYGDFTLFHFQRNPIPLFGAGLIDAVPDGVLETAARRHFSTFPEVSGRVSRLPDGRIGRFGWKAQEATLEEFVLTACAVELGLEVPGRHQAANPRDGEYQGPGLDLTSESCRDLVAFVQSLPAPSEVPPATGGEAGAVTSGRATFERIGCAACHVARLGEVQGIYSDLLLHDLGEDLGEIGSYGIALAEPAADEPAPKNASLSEVPAGVAARREWRTAPLWGLRDSAPYLHDGRAETLEQAIALHGGEAVSTAGRYFRLSSRERWQVQAFMKALGTPPGGQSPTTEAGGLPLIGRP